MRRTPTAPALLLVLTALLLALGLASSAFADEGDPAALVRQARVAETVERDLPRAMGLYRSALESGGTSDAARDAALALVRLHEQRGEASDALDLLRLLTDRFANRLAEPQKQAVHETMVRLLPPGSRARSPLGEVYVVPGARPADGASPLDAKVEELISRVDGIQSQSDANVAAGLRRSLEGALGRVGAEALPIFERILFEGHPERAQFAAEMYAHFGQERSLEGLERALREGDGFTREAGVAGLAKIAAGERASPQIVALVDRVLDLPELARNRSRLLGFQSRHLDGDAAMARHHAGGPDATHWLVVALSKKAEGSLERALDVVRAGGEDAARVATALIEGAFTSRPPVYPPESLGLDVLEALLDVLLANVHGASAENVARLVGLLCEKGPEARCAQARSRAWAAVATAHRSHRTYLVASLAQANHPPTDDLLRDPTWAEAFLEVLPHVAAHTSLMGGLVSREPFWEAVLDRTLNGRLPLRSLYNHLHSVLSRHPHLHLPEAIRRDPRWIRILQGSTEVERSFVLEAAARTGDPAFLALAANHLDSGNVHADWIHALTLYRGPGRLDFVREALADPTGRRAQLVHRLLGGEPEEVALLQEIARDPSLPVAPAVIARLRDFRATDALADLFERARGRQDLPRAYRNSLIEAAKTLVMREAVPFLVEDYRRTRSPDAAEALDAIREFRERIRALEDWAGEVPEEGSAGVLALLASEDPEVRRSAAVVAGAMGLRAARARLAEMAEGDPDPATRAAARQALERLR